MAAEGRFDSPRRIHVIGVGGAGMSAIAQVLAEQGHEVSGSDVRASATTERLALAGVAISIGHDAANLGRAEVVTASPAVQPGNVELRAAQAAGLEVLRRGTVLAELVARTRTIAVAGTHGKTTTSSMLTLIAQAAGLDPGFLIGAELAGAGSNARAGSGSLLVLEADESYGTFTELEPAIVALTNVEPDHLDHYGDVSALEQAFADLLARASEASVVVADDPVAARLGRAAGAVLVGTDPSADVVLGEVALGRATSRFTLDGGPAAALSIEVAAPGMHNATNAALAATAALLAGVDAASVVAGLARFTGVPRRFEFRGEVGGVSFVDDYAHLPTEVAATLAAARRGGWGRIVVIFQPHRYTRTQAVAAQFADAFAEADALVITALYGAGEEPIPGVTAQLVVDAVTRGTTPPLVELVEDRGALVERVAALLRPGDLCLTLGAGDLTTLPDQLRRRLEGGS